MATTAVVVVIALVAGVAGYYGGAASGTVSNATSTVTTTITQQSTVTSTVTATAESSTTTSTQTAASPPVLPASLPSATVSETGSSLLYPLFNLWVTNFTARYPTVKINTASTGSGTGQSQAETGAVQIGASDAYMSAAVLSQYSNMLNIPLAISAQQVNYNLPGIPQTTHLDFSGPVLAGIYNGTITYWDDSSIRALNPSVASLLPHQLIVPIHRSDGSGDTFLFTSYLSATSSSWSRNVGYGTTVNWPSVPSAQGDTGNAGMLQACSQKQYSIAYIGVSYLTKANTAGLGYAYLKNLAGNFVDISNANIQSAVNAMAPSTPPNEILSLVNAPGANSYPIVNYEYAIVSKVQSSSDVSQTVRAILDWSTLPNGGNSPYFLGQVGFTPLPQAIQQLSWAQISEIGP